MNPSEKNPPWGRQLEKTLKFVGRKKYPPEKDPLNYGEKQMYVWNKGKPNHL